MEAVRWGLRFQTLWSESWVMKHPIAFYHYDDVIMSTIASQITSLTIVYSTIYSGADQSKHQSSASLAFVWGIHREPVNPPHKWPVTRKMFPFDDVIMTMLLLRSYTFKLTVMWSTSLPSKYTTTLLHSDLSNILSMYRAVAWLPNSLHALILY